MKLADLRDTLAQHADRIDPSEPAPIDRLTARGRALKRRRSAMVAGTTVGVLAVSALAAPALTGGGREVGPAGEPAAAQMPSRPYPAGARDLLRNGIRYPEHIGGETLVAARIGGKGQTALEFRTVVPADMMFRPLCTVAPGSSVYHLRLQLGDLVIDPPLMCRSDGATAPSDEAALSREELPRDWAAKIPAGREVTVRAEVVDDNGDAVANLDPASEARIGLGVYDRGQMREVGDCRLPVARGYQGFTYRLAAEATAPLRLGSSVRLDLPAGRAALVVYCPGDLPTPQRLTRLSISEDDSWPEPDGSSVVARPPAPATTLEASVISSPPRGFRYERLAVAVYLAD